MKKQKTNVFQMTFGFLIVLSMLSYHMMYAYAAYSTPSSYTTRHYDGIWLWPLLGDHQRVSSYVGGRPSPGAGASTNHHGTDIPADTGTPIYAARGGTAYVMSSLFPNMAKGLGNWVLIDHGDGFYTAYGHMSSVHSRFNGNSADVPVAIGDVIGYVGETGVAYGSHLHFEIAYDWNGAGKASYYGHTWDATWGSNGWEIVDSSPATQTYVYWLSDVIKKGEEMPTGYDRTIPDGDYIIAMATNPLYYIDIDGADYPASNNTNVSLCQAASLDGIPAFDIWTVTYNSSTKFYTIKQKGTDMCLDVAGDGLAECGNVQAYSSSGQYASPKTSNWAISLNGRNGYRLQARSSGFSLDVNGGMANGANIQQYTGHDGDNQSWIFIPYMPPQPIENGRYLILSAMDTGYEIDMPGETADMGNGTNVNIWDIGAQSQYNSFDIEALSNGYYTLTNAASGKLLDVDGNNGTTYGEDKGNVQLWERNDGYNQQWAITPNGSGYVLRPRCSGYALDVSGSSAVNSANVHQWPYHGGANQTWYFVPAEFTVSYDANGGEGAPESQTKYRYASDMRLSETVPTREGYVFKYWATDAESVAEGSTVYNPGDVYAVDADLQLYAVWEQDYPRIELSAEKVTLEQYGEQYTLTATLHAGKTGASNLEWSIFHVGEDEWDDSLEFSSDGDTAVIKPKETTGNYLVLCSTTDKEAMTSCLVTVLPAAVTGITLDRTELSLKTGDMTTLTASITPEYTTLTDVNWSSSDTGVATVSFGDVYARAEGIATITCESASDPSIKATCTVKIIEPVISIKLNRSVYEFSDSSEGGMELIATLLPENATNKSVTWNSSNTAVATVTNGIVRPFAPGYTRITCTSIDGPVGICDVVVHADNIMHLPAALTEIEEEAFYGSSIEEVILSEGATTIESKAFANCQNLSLIYIPSNVASIASDAFRNSPNVVIISDGICTATLYAQNTGIPYVIGSMPEEVQFIAYDNTLFVGRTMKLYSHVQPDDAPQAVKWSILEGDSIATIEASGNECTLTASGVGHVTVAATTINGITGTADISIIEHATEFEVWFDANGGTCDTSYLNARFDEALGTLPVPVRDYYTFNGWYTSTSGGTRVTSDTVYDDYDMSDITLYAHWTEHEWSDWVTEDQLPTGTIQKESKQQYRYQDKIYSEWSSWGSRMETRESTGELKKERQLTEHYWYYDLCQNCGRHSPYTVCWDCGYNIGANWRVAWLDTSRSEGSQFGNSDKIFTMTDDGRWFYWTDDNGNGDSRTVYQYATRTYAWSDWSEWIDDYVASSATRNVESRYVYRYKLS